jgi:hypothetical protein
MLKQKWRKSKSDEGKSYTEKKTQGISIDKDMAAKPKMFKRNSTLGGDNGTTRIIR